MSNVPEGIAQFEYAKMQLMGSLGNVAEQMRSAAAVAEQFAQLISHVPYGAGIQNMGQFQVPAAPVASTPGRKRKAAVADDGDGKKKRKQRDPNAPKRPASSYLIFQNDVRQQLKQEHPTKSNNELLTMIAKLWSEMPKEKKEAYETRQKAAKEQWITEKAAYDVRGSPDGVVAAVPVPVTPIAVKPLPKAVAKPVATPATPATPAVASTSEESSSDAASSDDDSSEEEEDVAMPPPKKSKKEDADVPKAEQTPAKEKKPKLSKA